MNQKIYSVDPEMGLADVIEFLLKHEISNAPVLEKLDGRSRLVGFISEGDCLEALANESFFGSPSPSQSARTIMRSHPVCVSPNTDLFSLASIFTSHGYRHLPVTENGHLLGIVSRRDILKAMDSYYRETIADREGKRSPPDLREIINQRFLVTR